MVSYRLCLILFIIVHISGAVNLPRVAYMPVFQSKLVRKNNFNEKIEVFKKSLERVPLALNNTIQVSMQAILSNCAIMIPLCLLAGLFHRHPNINIWFSKSLKAGISWGTVACAYAGGEEFLKVLRQKDDVWNRSIASGLASGLFQIQSDGKSGFPLGFVSGFGFVLVIDIFEKHLEKTQKSNKKL
jgi:hypothetical protein